MKSITGPNWTVYHADCRTAFAAVPEQSVHCVMTSPPYWGGIRDYQIPPCAWSDGWEGCYGNEPTVQQYVTHTLEIFDVLRRVLRDDGVIFWNLGDTYASGEVGRHDRSDGATGAFSVGRTSHGKRKTGKPKMTNGNKALVPFRVAIALQDAGWAVRQEVIWDKPSPMPESVDGTRWEQHRYLECPECQSRKTKAAKNDQRHCKACGFSDHKDVFLVTCSGCDKCRPNGGLILRRGAWRPTCSHEYVLMIAKSNRYFCDAAAAQEPTTGNAHSRGKGTHPKSNGTRPGQQRQNGDFSAAVRGLVEMRNPRSVWRISSEAYKGKHFAAYPTMLAWKCIQAATSASGCCSDCGAQYAPIVEKARVPTRPGNDTKVGDYQVLDPDSPYQDHAGTICGNRDPQRHIAVKRTLGYRPTCTCNAGDPCPCTVADPFTGSGTTLQVAINTGRRFVGSEVAEHYLPLIQERAATPWEPRTDRNAKPAKRRRRHKLQRSLFS